MGFAKVTISAPVEVTLPTNGGLINGEANPLYPFVTYLNTQIADRKRSGDRYVWQGSMDLSQLTIELMATAADSGFEFSSVPLFMSIDLTANVPDQWRGEDENGNPIDQTWQEYFDATPTRTPLVIGTGTYTAVAPRNDYMPFTEALSLGVTLYTAPAIQALQQQQK